MGKLLLAALIAASLSACVGASSSFGTTMPTAEEYAQLTDSELCWHYYHTGTRSKARPAVTAEMKRREFTFEDYVEKC